VRYHTFHYPDGTVRDGELPYAIYEAMKSYIKDVSFIDKTVLDIGCWVILERL